MAGACCSQERGANSDPSLEERSYYIDYIYKDLEPWKEKGITEVPFNTIAFQADGHHVCRLLTGGAPAAHSCVACCPVMVTPCTWVLGSLCCWKGCFPGAAFASGSGGARPCKAAAPLQQLAAGAMYVWVFTVASAFHYQSGGIRPHLAATAGGRAEGLGLGCAPAGGTLLLRCAAVHCLRL
jgi:hypothetical protein